MSTTDFDKFDLDGLSLEDMEPVKKTEPSLDELAQEIKPVEPSPKVNAEPVIEAAPPPVPEDNVEVIEVAAPPPPAPPQVAPQPPQQTDAAQAENANVPEGSIVCPKCEHVQPQAEQCVNCGVYVKKALAQGQSKIQITHTKF